MAEFYLPSFLQPGMVSICPAMHPIFKLGHENTPKKEFGKMKSTKLMMSGIMLMLLCIFAAIADTGRNSWLAGASVILLFLAIAIFIIGLIFKN